MDGDLVDPRVQLPGSENELRPLTESRSVYTIVGLHIIYLVLFTLPLLLIGVNGYTFSWYNPSGQITPPWDNGGLIIATNSMVAVLELAAFPGLLLKQRWALKLAIFTTGISAALALPQAISMLGVTTRNGYFPLDYLILFPFDLAAAALRIPPVVVFLFVFQSARDSNW